MAGCCRGEAHGVAHGGRWALARTSSPEGRGLHQHPATAPGCARFVLAWLWPVSWPRRHKNMTALSGILVLWVVAGAATAAITGGRHPAAPAGHNCAA